MNEEYYKEIHTEQITALKEFHDFCMENNIKYSLDGGSLLGAVREKGFIPWDDDVDICFFRDEYEKFNKIFREKGINQKFVVDKYGFEIWYKDGDKRGISLDVIIFDYISEKPIVQKIKYILLLILKAMNRTKKDMEFVKKRGKYKGFKFFVYYFIYLIGRLIPKKTKYKLEENIRKSFVGNKTLVHRSKAMPSELLEIFKKEIISKYIIVPFENTELMIFEDYKSLLLKMYGEDYMIPKKDDDCYSRFMRNEYINELLKDYY